jgi:hypothetical protein
MEQTFTHLMVDIETLGTDVNSVVISIGAAEFNIHDGSVGRKFKQNISIDSCLHAGLDMNPDTVAWWQTQSKEARDAVIVGQAPLTEALKAFSNFIGTNIYYVWGNSARFDLGILQNCFNKTKIALPWTYRMERCLRTLAGLRPEIVKSTIFDGIRHDALADCLHQIKYCTEVYNSLNNNTLTEPIVKEEKKVVFLQPVYCISRNPLISSPIKYFNKDKSRLIGLYQKAKENNAKLVFVNQWKKTDDVKIIFIKEINNRGVQISNEIVTDKSGYNAWLKDTNNNFTIQTIKTK